MKTTRQLNLLASQPKAYGGALLNTRKGRTTGRPLDTRHTMHLVLRSSKATGNWSFSKKENRVKIKNIIEKFSRRFGVRIFSFANVGNHLHFHIKLSNRFTYKPFIRAVTAAIAMAITGVNRWSAMKYSDKKSNLPGQNTKFWDLRPYTRVVVGQRAFLTLKDYIQINVFEGFGFTKHQAKFYFRLHGNVTLNSG